MSHVKISVERAQILLEKAEKDLGLWKNRKKGQEQKMSSMSTDVSKERLQDSIAEFEELIKREEATVAELKAALEAPF